MEYLQDKEVCIVGGTGSLGKELLSQLLQSDAKGIRIFSRDELKQWELRRKIEADPAGVPVSFILGDVRDVERLRRAFAGVDIVINAAALKQVPACEDNPQEAVKTNVLGTANIIEAALDCGVEKVVHVSTDKAVYPVNLYGATKAVAEKLVIDANVYSGSNYPTRFSCVRYGNVIGSRGSIVPLFRELAAAGKAIPITDMAMSRFFVRLEKMAGFILEKLGEMQGGEIFVPKMSAAKIVDIIAMVAPGCRMEVIGIRPGEKLHECIIAAEEFDGRCEPREFDYVIYPNKRKELPDWYKRGGLYSDVVAEINFLDSQEVQ